MKFYFHEKAEAEFEKAVEYYEGCQPGIGLEFSQEIFATIRRIIQYPEAWAQLSRHTRRCLANRFPFGVIFSNQIRISAHYRRC